MSDSQQSAQRRFARRGNAMIMAVGMTVMLAIIGSTFVIMTRMERTAVRGFGDNVTADQVVDVVIDRIEEVLTDDLVDNKVDTSGYTTSAEWLALRNRFLDGKDPNGLGYGDVGVDRFTLREAYDVPTDADPWLAATEPTGPVTNPTWKQLTSLWDPNSWTGPAQSFDSNAPAGHLVVADADGDGITDSKWVNLSAGNLFNIPGKEVFAAVRIIDNCSMVNVNTAWGAYDLSNTTGLDAHGQVLSQVDLQAITGRAGVVVDDAFMTQRLGSYPTTLGSKLPRYIQPIAYQAAIVSRLANPLGDWADGSDFDPWTNNYPSTRYPWPDGITNGSVDTPDEVIDPTSGESGWWQSFQPYGVNEELELRNRFCMNSYAISRLENFWPDVTGDFSNRSKFSGTDLEFWYRRMTDLYPDAPNGIALDQRHLLTAYSWDRDVRPGLWNGVAKLNQRLGFARKMNMQRVIHTIMTMTPADWEDPTSLPLGYAPPYPNTPGYVAGYEAISKLVDVFEAAGRTRAEAAQFVANLRDYLDPDSNITVIPKDSPLGLGVDIFGYERQPFFTEAFFETTDASSNFAWYGIELFNPYASLEMPIKLEGWKIETTGPVPQTIILDDYWIKGNGRLLIVSSSEPAYAPGFSTAVPLPDPQIGEHDLETVLSVVPQNQEYMATGITLRPTTKTIKLVRTVMTNSGSHDIVMDEIDLTDPTLSDFVSGVYTKLPDHIVNPATMTSLQRGPKYLYGFTDPLILANRYGWKIAGGGFAFEAEPVDSYLDPADEMNGDIAFGMLCKPNTEMANRCFPLPVLNASMEPGDYNYFGQLEHSMAELAKVALIGNDKDDPITSKMGKTDESAVRLNFANSAGDGQLLSLFSFFSRADDGIDNADEDADYNGFTYDSLKETRIPGRINVNTASRAVLRALVPPVTINMPYGSSMPYGSPKHEALRDFVAEAIIANRPYASVSDFARKMANDRAWLGRWNAEYESGNVLPETWDPRDYNPGIPDQFLTNMADPFVMGDFEERDYLFNRMANLITTRSDTFTAYILVRVQDASSTVERRHMAIFDRSNVFLPEALAETPAEPFTDSDANGWWDVGEPFVDWDSNGLWDLNDYGGELQHYYNITAGAYNLNTVALDPDYFDRQYVKPKLVALRQVPDVR